MNPHLIYNLFASIKDLLNKILFSQYCLFFLEGRKARRNVKTSMECAETLD